MRRFLIWIGSYRGTYCCARCLTENNSVKGSDQEKTFGPTISGLIKDNIEPERYILWDSKKRGGRPDTRKLLLDTYKSFDAEGMSSSTMF